MIYGLFHFDPIYLISYKIIRFGGRFGALFFIIRKKNIRCVLKNWSVGF